MSTDWDPSAYLRYADERSRPFGDLLARVEVDATARRVVDLGCGPGHLTGLLRGRWPQARITGVDHSAQMIRQAREQAGGGVDYRQTDLRDWHAADPVDVLVTNATLQWIPDHLDLLARLQEAVAPGGALALGVPGNGDAPSHRALRAVCAQPAYADLVPAARPVVAHDPQVYLDALARPDWRVDAWETTYLHVLPGEDPVLNWISATGARPALQALPDDLRRRFEAELGARLRDAYPAGPQGTVLPFRRVFAVAHREDSR